MKKEKFGTVGIVLYFLLYGLRFRVVISVEDVRCQDSKAVRQEMIKLRKI